MAYLPIIRGGDPRLRLAGPVRLTFTGAAGLGQAGTNSIIFTVTGAVIVEYVYGLCITSLTEALATATVSLGVTNQATLFVGATNSVDIDINELWLDTVPSPDAEVIPAAVKQILIRQNVIVAAAVQNTNGGAVDFYCYWRPATSDGNLA